MPGVLVRVVTFLHLRNLFTEREVVVDAHELTVEVRDHAHRPEVIGVKVEHHPRRIGGCLAESKHRRDFQCPPGFCWHGSPYRAIPAHGILVRNGY